MAWLARSIANSLKLDEDEDDENGENQRTKTTSGEKQPPSPLQSQSPRGVKEDLSELTKTLRSQFWGVASFLAPPPTSSDRPDHVEENRTSSDLEGGEEDLIAGIRNDFAEIGGRFKTGISKISGNIAVSEFTKIASNFLQLGSEDANLNEYSVGDVVGVTEEVVAFARDIAMHPETWLDFPLPDEDDNFDDFELNDAQQEHALVVERLAPAIAALRVELCPAYMSEGCFWRIYFVLLHPKISKHDALLLSTPQVLEARALLSHELQKRSKATAENSGTAVEEAPENVEKLSGDSKPVASETVPIKTITAETTHYVETEKHPVYSKEIQFVDKSVIEEKPTVMHDGKPMDHPSVASYGVTDIEVEDEADDWLKDEEEDISRSIRTGGTTMPLGYDEDVSFSDLEEEDDEDGGDVPVSYKKVGSSEKEQEIK
ncbi:PREDICTED: uncharacterized protein LOC104827707 [Tarenaya hassleriana]|uniref:uncharacterized protein LOC104827707 n=1 Tax=Tarenaya hassleriana TaxID=28532 RepID=UPI00053C2367|nr:PREDICTED: uncharacterized protein LOC104827707 [Tarenaya hassleriana]